MTTEIERIAGMEARMKNIESSSDKTNDKLESISSKTNDKLDNLIESVNDMKVNQVQQIDIIKDLIYAVDNSRERKCEAIHEKVNDRIEGNVTWVGLGKATGGLFAIIGVVFSIVKYFL